MTPNPVHYDTQDPKESPRSWLYRNSRLTLSAFLVFIAPLLLGMTLPGERINDPQGWLVGFWRYVFVFFIVLLQLVCFAVGWLRSDGRKVWGTVARRILAGIYIVLMSFWLGRDYFFGVDADWWVCIRWFLICFVPTLLLDGIAPAGPRYRKARP